MEVRIDSSERYARGSVIPERKDALRIAEGLENTEFPVARIENVWRTVEAFFPRRVSLFRDEDPRQASRSTPRPTPRVENLRRVSARGSGRRDVGEAGARWTSGVTRVMGRHITS